MAALGWTVLGLVFLDELLGIAAFGVWGWAHDPRWLLVWLLPLAAMTVWFLVASPRATYGGTLARPVAKVVVFGLASLALWDAGHPSAALALLVFSVIVNGLAMLPPIAQLATEAGPGREQRA